MNATLRSINRSMTVATTLGLSRFRGARLDDVYVNPVWFHFVDGRGADLAAGAPWCH